MTWWMWALLAAVMAMAGVGFAFLALSAGTAFGTDYHTLTPRQRWMARWLARAALFAALLCGCVGLLSSLRAVAPLLSGI
jgi:hypothetical protein